MHADTIQSARKATGPSSIVELERKLQSRRGIEKAFFDESWVAYPMLLGAVCIWGVELTANINRGSGWSSVAHLIVIGALQVFALVALAAGLRTLIWRWRLAKLRRRMRSEIEELTRRPSARKSPSESVPGTLSRVLSDKRR